LPQQKIDRDESQANRFKEAAREVGADESDNALGRIMGRLDVKKKPEPERGVQDK
jgi:hypothetical protein